MSALSNHSELPVAVIGAGPVGLAAAAHLVTRGVPVKVYEAGESVAAHVRSWGHVRLFSPWGYTTDSASTAILRDHGWQEPPRDVLPTGGDLYAAYLQPLAQTPELEAVIETGARVRAVSRAGIDKVVSRNRADHPFGLAIEGAGGLRIDLARAVIDASGTWTSPNPLGASGMPAPGEAEHADRIAYGIPDVLGGERPHYLGRRVLVIGGGHSAANALLDLARLAEADARGHLVWALRATNFTRIFGSANDKLPARGKLGHDLKQLVESGRLRVVTGFHAGSVEACDGGLLVTGSSTTIGPVDRVIVATGLRPDLAMTRELRLDLDPWLESPRALGPMIDPNLHSCGTVPPHGYKALAHPEPGYFAVGIKSYGRAPTFLMATGYEQVRSVAAHLAGDEAAANDVRLVLPETGVCTTDIPGLELETKSCCGGPPPAASDACCMDDANAKAAGQSGCGCGTEQRAEPAKAECCAA
jgi:thioredoxin reductase